jgi:uncharacterized protein
VPSVRVRRMEVFGSVARGEETVGSDVDLLIDLEPDDEPTYQRLDRLASELGSRWTRSVDLVPADRIANPYVRRQVDREKRPLYVA